MQKRINRLIEIWVRTAHVLLCYAIKCHWNGSVNRRSLSSLTFLFTGSVFAEVLCDCLFETVVISESLRRVCIPLWSLLESKVAKPARVLLASISLVVGASRRWWVSTGSLTNHGSWLWRLFGRSMVGVVSGRGVLVVCSVRGRGRSAFSRVEHWISRRVPRLRDVFLVLRIEGWVMFGLGL